MKKIIFTILIFSIAFNVFAKPKLHEILREPEKYIGQKVEWRGRIRDIEIRQGKTCIVMYYEPFGTGDVVPDNDYVEAIYDGETKRSITFKKRIKIKGTFIGFAEELPEEQQKDLIWTGEIPVIKIDKIWKLKTSK